ncbi:Double Clp-N motif-containing P-loop nucleoside triphosphate hydrolase superfamily protein [Forsythia ovata]|uniref:Double Clp-N motif-containing P-loop nucleoside triphosphate hydrolase superfamily protein n=1 Tax=Forsythia ovata TaxID=205694 RepID=A0ABD1SNS6_9LAMI
MMLSTATQLSTPPTATPSTVVPLANRNIYLNPRLQQGGTGQMGNQRSEEVKKVLDILVRTKKRNPVLVGDSEPEAVVKELFRKIESKELGAEGPLKNVQVISIEKEFLYDKNQILSKIKELDRVIESRIVSGGVILDLGDLKWLVEQPMSFGGAQQQQVVSDIGRAAVVEMGKLLARFTGDGTNDNNLWLIGTATCETYLRCQVYHSTMENDWDLQAVPITSRSPLLGIFPRVGTERILSNPGENLNPLKSVPTLHPALTRRVSENLDPAQRTSFCPQCSDNYEKELSKLVAIEKSFSEAKQEDNRPSLPLWLKNAKLQSSDAKTIDQSEGKYQEVLSKQKTQELQKKWRETCLHLHPNYHHKIHSDRTAPPALSMPSLCNPNLFVRPPFQPRLQTTKPLGEVLQLNTNPVTSQPQGCTSSIPGSPVRTDLVLGPKGTENTPEKATEDGVKDLLGCISSEPQTKVLDKFADALDADTYKKLLKGLKEKAWWQAEAATAVASAITRCRLGNGRCRGAGSRGDTWLLFTGPDRVGKKKMSSVLAEQICGTIPVIICLGSQRGGEESDMNFRGKTAIDRIAEAVRHNPFSVIMLEDIDEADMILRGSVKRAIERGRLTDSHGREISLGNAIFILTGDWSTTNPEATRDGHVVDGKKLASIASRDWQLGLIVREKSAKRRVNWLQNEDRPIKPRRELGSGLSLDLNLAVDTEDDRTDGSHNSSDLTIDHEDELGLVGRQFTITSVPHELASIVDDSIVFKPVDSSFVRREIKNTISVKFSMVVGDNLPIEIEDDVLEKILGGLWHDQTSLEQWIENVLAPSFNQLKPRLPSIESRGLVVRLVVESDSGERRNGDWLPSRITVEG